MTDTTRTPTVLVIRDGWGENPNTNHDAFNAVKIAETPVAEMLDREWARTLVRTDGFDVGLPEGTMGNSEVGHQNIGAGRVVYQDAVRITKTCRSGELAQNEAIVSAIVGARNDGKAVHLMGLNSDAGVHAQLEHLYAIVELCAQLGHQTVYIHLFTDGRDTGPFTGRGYAQQVEQKCAEFGVGRVVSVMGRYWAMDRDNRWERVARAYACLTGRNANAHDVAHRDTADNAFAHAYDNPPGETMKGDEFVEPTTIGDDWEETRITDGDTVIFYNYRGDRPREICAAFLLPEFEDAEAVGPSPASGARGFDRGERLDLRFVLMTAYSERLTALAPVAFPKPPKMTDTLGDYLSKKGLPQFRCAETEKFPHVTFFFNDYRDDPFAGERRAIVQSPKDATYALQPEMSALGVRDAVLARLDAANCEDLIVVNFANPDMVGHTGSLEAAVKACETVDACVGALIEKTLDKGGQLIVTADHGNCEQMFSPENDAPHTAHTLYPVPLYVVGEAHKGRTLRDGGRLADIAPTLLDMMGVEKPAAMTGRSLLT